jgi:hypothetical protein
MVLRNADAREFVEVGDGQAEEGGRSRGRLFAGFRSSHSDEVYCFEILLGHTCASD